MDRDERVARFIAAEMQRQAAADRELIADAYMDSGLLTAGRQSLDGEFDLLALARALISGINAGTL